MGCNNITKCIGEPDLQDDDSSDPVSVEIISTFIESVGTTSVTDLALNLGGVSQ